MQRAMHHARKLPPHGVPHTRPDRKRGSVVWHRALLSLAVIGGLAENADAASLGETFYRVEDGKVDARTYNGFRRYHAGCSHCHGPDGIGSTFAPSLIDPLPDVDTFRHSTLHGVVKGTSVMKGFAGDPNFEPYVDDVI
jgi:mono/diheme cytochrome c family protein